MFGHRLRLDYIWKWFEKFRDRIVVPRWSVQRQFNEEKSCFTTCVRWVYDKLLFSYISFRVKYNKFSLFLHHCAFFFFFTAEEIQNDFETMQETAKRIFSVHSVLLGRGFALSSPPTVSQALDGVLPFR